MQMQIILSWCERGRFVVAVGTHVQIREGWGVLVGTRRSIQADQAVNEGWSPAEISLPYLPPYVGADVAKLVADALAYAATFDVTAFARSAEQMGILE
jgi:hypothetical protein